MIRKRWLALIGAVLGPLTCFGGARADEGIIIIHPGPSAGGVSPEELAAAVNASSAISRAAVRSAFIQTQQIDQDLTSLREIWEAEEGAPVAYLSDADGYVVRLAAAQSGVPLFSQVSSGAASSFASDLQALAEKRINVFATGFGVFGNNNGTGGAGSYGYNQPGMTAGVGYQVNDRLLLGSSFGFNQASSNGGGSDTDTSTYLFSAYGNFRPTPKSYIQASIGYGAVLTNSAVTGAGLAKQSSTANQLNGSASAGYDFRTGAVRLTPYTTLQGSETWFPSHALAGAGPNSIFDNAYQASSVDLAGGIEAAYQVATRWGLFIPSARAEYHHEFIDQAFKLSGTEGSQMFLASSASSVPNYALVGARARLLLRDGTDVSLAYERTLGQGAAYYSSVSLSLSRYF